MTSGTSPTQAPSPKDNWDFLFTEAPSLSTNIKQTKAIGLIRAAQKLRLSASTQDLNQNLHFFTKNSYLGKWGNQRWWLDTFISTFSKTLLLPKGWKSLCSCSEWNWKYFTVYMLWLITRLLFSWCHSGPGRSIFLTVTIQGRFDTRSVFSQWLQAFTVTVPRTWGL